MFVRASGAGSARGCCMAGAICATRCLIVLESGAGASGAGASGARKWCWC
jgi:hypothetical protein